MSDAPTIWKQLAWDTEFFGVKTARIVPARLELATLKRALAECQAWGAQVIHYLADTDHDPSVQLVEQAGFHFVDIRMTFEWRPTSLPTLLPIDEVRVRDHTSDDLATLQAIARASYRHSRFYYDQRYSRERCDEFYALWIAQSCGGAAERVFVAEWRGEPIGFLSCHLHPGEVHGQIGLVGIRADARGLKVGRLLVQTAQHWFAEQGARQVTVVTQGRNIAAQRLYQRTSFVTSAAQLWYHKWLD